VDAAVPALGEFSRITALLLPAGGAGGRTQGARTRSAGRVGRGSRSARAGNYGITVYPSSDICAWRSFDRSRGNDAHGRGHRPGILYSKGYFAGDHGLVGDD
jgi:hypothetical protein